MTQKRPAIGPDSLPVDAIRVGKRFRQQLGDIDALAASIAEHGLLHPVVVTPERDLVAGERRLLAVRQLGWAEVPVRVVTPADLLRAEADENAVRLDFAPSEAVAVAEALRPHVAAEHPQGRPEKGGNLPPIQPAKNRDRLAAAVGMSGRTLDKAAAVVRAVEADPELAPIADEMDATGNVDRAFQKLRRAQPEPARADLEITDLHRAKFPHLAAADLRVQVTDAMYAFGNPGKFEPEEWAERVSECPPDTLANVRQHIAYIHRWVDRWEQALARPALSLVRNAE